MKQHRSTMFKVCVAAVTALSFLTVVQLYANESIKSNPDAKHAKQQAYPKAKPPAYVPGATASSAQTPRAAIAGGRTVNNGILDQGGENCADAVVLPSMVPQLVAGTTVGYANDYSAAGLGSAPECWDGSYHELYCSAGPDVTYVFTAPAADSYNFSLCGSSYDTGLMIYDYTCPTEPVNPDDFICGNDDACGYQSMIADLLLASGQTVLIVVDGYGIDAGDYQLAVFTDSCYAICAEAPELELETPTLVNTCAGCNLYLGTPENNCEGAEYSSGLQTIHALEIVTEGSYCIDVVGDPEAEDGTADVQFLLFTDCADPTGSCVCSQDQNYPPTGTITGPSHTEHACCQLLPGTYYLGVSAYSAIASDCGEITVSVAPSDECISLADKLDTRTIENIPLGPLFINTSDHDSVFIVNTSELTLELFAGTDRPAAMTPLTGSGFVLNPGDSTYIPLYYAALEPGWVDVSLMLSTDPTFTLCEPFYIPLSIEGLPALNVPGAPVLTPGIGNGCVHLQVHTNNNPTYTLYSVAVSLDGWMTTQYLQTDGTLGPAPMWAEEGDWNTIISEDISGIPPFSTLEVKVAAGRLGVTTDYGPVSSYYFADPGPFMATPEALTVSRQGDDLILRWSPPEILFSTTPIIDAIYKVESGTSLDGPFTLVEETTDTTLTIAGEMLNGELKFFRVLLFSELGPLQPALRLTIPAPGEIVDGDHFIIAAVDHGSGAYLEGVSAVFEAKIGGIWAPVTETTMPQWMAGSGIYSTMVDATPIPSGPCSLRVVETGPFGDAIAAHEVLVNRAPVAQIEATVTATGVMLSAAPSSDPDGSISATYWTFPDYGHDYTPIIDTIFYTPDTTLIDLTVNDNYGRSSSTTIGIWTDGVDNYIIVNIRCGCARMDVFSSGRIRGAGKYFPPGNRSLPGTDSTRLGQISHTYRRGRATFGSYNFEVHAHIKMVAGDPPEDCTHYQKFQLDEKCNGQQVNTNLLYGQPTWDDAPIGGASWASDNYSDNQANNHIQRRQLGANSNINWLDGPFRGMSNSYLRRCGPTGFTYDCIFCSVVDGPLGCCRCKFRVKWTMNSNGGFTSQPTLDSTNDPEDPDDDMLGCVRRNQGLCGCEAQ